MASQVNSTKHTKNNLYPSCLNFSKRLKKEHSKTFYEATITLIPKPDKDTIKKENYRLTSLMNVDKNSEQNFSQPNPTTYKKDHIPQPSGIHLKFTRMVQYIQINQCHTQH